MKHGETFTRIHSIWKGMKERCLNPNASNFHNYGGKGITVCPSWCDYINFRNWAVSSGYKRFLTLERIDSTKGYYPDNCRWATRAEQMRNTNRNIWLTAFGETKLQKDWIDDERCLASAATFKGRIKEGWTVEQALTIPPLKRGKGAISYNAPVKAAARNGSINNLR